MKKKTKENKVKESNDYFVVLETIGKTYEATAPSVDEALGMIGLEWWDIKNKGTITISRNGKSYEKVFYIKILKRIFANKITRMMWGKRLELLLSN